MSYHIYQTEGLVLRGLAYREADRSLRILTPDLGLIDASASGIRLEKSKLRYSLQELSHSSLSLVRGKLGWRVTSASERHSFFAELRDDRPRLDTAFRVLSLLLRQVTGEEASPEFFTLVLDGLKFIAAVPEISLPNAECLMVLRMLRHLGYIGETSPELEALLESGEWNPGILESFAPLRRSALGLINTALRQSQL